MKKILSLIIVLLATSFGCSIYHISSDDVTSNYYPSKPSAEDIVYLEEITQPHEVIGQITVNAERRQRIDEVIQKMKREAGILGGDAITNLQSDATGVWKQLPAQNIIGNGYVRANFSATVIAYQ